MTYSMSHIHRPAITHAILESAVLSDPRHLRTVPEIARISRGSKTSKQPPRCSGQCGE